MAPKIIITKPLHKRADTGIRYQRKSKINTKINTEIAIKLFKSNKDDRAPKFIKAK